MPIRPGLATRAGRRLAPSGLAIVQAPAGATSGVPFGTPLIVRLTDLFGNPVTKSGQTATVSIQSGSGSITNGSAVSDNAGLLTFTSLIITGSGAFTLLVDGPLLSPVTTSLSLTAIASQFQILAMPSAGTDNQAFTTQPSLRLLDAVGTPVLQAGVVVTAAVFTGNGTLIGTVTATTDATGTATFATLGINDADL